MYAKTIQKDKNKEILCSILDRISIGEREKEEEKNRERVKEVADIISKRWFTSSGDNESLKGIIDSIELYMNIKKKEEGKEIGRNREIKEEDEVKEIINDIITVLSYIVELEEDFLSDVIWDGDMLEDAEDIDYLDGPVGSLFEEYEDLLKRRYITTGFTIKEYIDGITGMCMYVDLSYLLINDIIERVVERCEEMVGNISKVIDDPYKFKDADEPVILTSILKMNMCEYVKRREKTVRYTPEKVYEDFKEKNMRCIEEYIEMISVLTMIFICMINLGIM